MSVVFYLTRQENIYKCLKIMLCIKCSKTVSYHFDKYLSNYEIIGSKHNKCPNFLCFRFLLCVDCWKMILHILEKSTTTTRLRETNSTFPFPIVLYTDTIYEVTLHYLNLAGTIAQYFQSYCPLYLNNFFLSSFFGKNILRTI